MTSSPRHDWSAQLDRNMSSVASLPPQHLDALRLRNSSTAPYPSHRHCSSHPERCSAVGTECPRDPLRQQRRPSGRPSGRDSSHRRRKASSLDYRAGKEYDSSSDESSTSTSSFSSSTSSSSLSSISTAYSSSSQTNTDSWQTSSKYSDSGIY